jgi:1,4-dihydroxy-2-naphthoate polyprenyltransferase
MKIWFDAIRPKTLIISISSVLIGTAMAMSDGSFNPLMFFFTLLTAMGIQICANLVNDYYDYLKGADTKERKGPVRATASGLISSIAMRRACFFSFASTLIIGSYLIWEGGLLVSLLLALSLLLAFCYTGGPYPIAYLGFGEIFVFIFFGLFAVSGTYFLQTGVFSKEALLAGIGPGAISVAVLIANNLRDYEEDLKASKKNLVVRFGRLFGKCEYLLSLLIAIFLPFLFFPEKPFLLLSSLTLFPALFLFYSLFKAKDAAHFIPIFAKTPQFLLLYTFLFIMGWML